MFGAGSWTEREIAHSHFCSFCCGFSRINADQLLEARRPLALGFTGDANHFLNRLLCLNPRRSANTRGLPSSAVLA